MSPPGDVQRPVPATWHELASDDHVWLKWRFTCALAQVRTIGLPLDQPLEVLEVGCGQGALAHQLETCTQWVVDGVDIDPAAIAGANGTQRGRLFHYDVRERRDDLRERYDVLVLFDILEHIEDTASFLAAAVAHLRKGGRLLVNVPAYPRLRGRYDVAVGHLRRYGPRRLATDLEAAGLEVDDVRYWGLSLVPVLLLRTLLLWVKRAEGGEAIRAGFSDESAFVRMTLTAMMRAETSLFAQPPAGTSLLAAATKR